MDSVDERATEFWAFVYEGVDRSVNAIALRFGERLVEGAELVGTFDLPDRTS